MDETSARLFRTGLAILFCGTVVVGTGLGSCAAYNSVRVWNATTAGEAELAQATQNRKIRVLEAQAKMDSASLEANAEIARARGVAKANQIVADSLGGPDGYLRYLYIQNMEQTQNQIIYIPTEGGLPILEASRLSRPAVVEENK